MTAHLDISIVLYQPVPRLLEITLHTLNLAVEHVRREGHIENCTLLLTDHSFQPLGNKQLQDWHILLDGKMKLDYRHNPDNPGFGSGHNAAFARSGQSADYFLVANPDLEFTEESLAAGLSFLACHPDIGMLAPALIQDEHRLAPACFRYPDLLTLALRMLGGRFAANRSHFYECRDWNALQAVFSPPIISGCCMLFRCNCFQNLGGFDPAFFLYFEDFDLSRRASQMHQSAYCPLMQVRHQGGGASRKGWKHIWMFSRSALRFFQRHGWRWY